MSDVGGLYHLFSTLLKEGRQSLKTFFPDDVCGLLFSFAMFRWAYNTPIKRAPYYYNHDFCSEESARKAIDDKVVSDMLKPVGERRANVVDWMKSLRRISNFSNNSI